MRVVHYFRASILSHCPFMAFHCADYSTFKRAACLSCDQPGSCVPVGMNANKKSLAGNKPGSMYRLETGKKQPYCGEIMNLPCWAQCRFYSKRWYDLQRTCIISLCLKDFSKHYDTEPLCIRSKTDQWSQRQLILRILSTLQKIGSFLHHYFLSLFNSIMKSNHFM